MNNIALKILRKLEKNGEMTLEELSKMIPKVHGDHRDFYILASLVSNGFLDDEILVDDDKPDPNLHKDQLLARKYYACSTADKSAEYEKIKWHLCGDGTLKSQKFALSGKGSLYLSEFRVRRFDRVFTLASGIIIGILVALVGAYLRSIFRSE